jgi:hypothetical protein
MSCWDFPHTLLIMVKVKVKLPLCLIKHFIIKTYGGVEVEHAFLASALDGGEKPAERPLYPQEKNPGTHWTLTLRVSY